MVITVGLAWVLFSLPLATLVGRTVRLADETAGSAFRTDGIERYLAEQAPAPLP